MTVLVGFIVTAVNSMLEHDYAMWDICYPAIRKWDTEHKINPDELSQDNWSRSWYQHLECENNLLPFPWGKEAKFSANPPSFIPAK